MRPADAHAAVQASRCATAPGRVRALFLRDGAGRRPVESLTVDADGIVGGVPRPPLRQLLLVDACDLAALGLGPGELFEDVVLEGPGLMGHASGTALEVGTARFRLTFRCEPCARVRGIAPAKLLVARRGYLAQVVAPGTLRIGDAVTIGAERFEPIPDRPRERVAWVLARAPAPLSGAELLRAAGLHRSYSRALPSWSRSWPPELAARYLPRIPVADQGGSKRAGK